MTVQSTDELISVIQELSYAKELPVVIDIVRQAARRLTGADGAAFILRDEDKCFYVEEDAIGPLWKGKRFPLTACISGWVMLNKKAAVIPDIYKDERIPHDAYRPTFVKSLIMVPVRENDPLASIGTYWKEEREAKPEEIKMLQALANATSVALENVRLYTELQNKVVALEQSNAELKRFSWVTSHDLKEPLRTITTYSQMLEQRSESFDAKDKNFFGYVNKASKRLYKLVDDILSHARVDSVKDFGSCESKTAISDALEILKPNIEELGVKIEIGSAPEVRSNPALLSQLFYNLILNAIKFRKADEKSHIVINSEDKGSSFLFSVADNGIGIDPKYHERIFGYFERLHSQDEYPGSGIGLNICKKIVESQKGKIWVESILGHGSTFYFTMPKSDIVVS